MGKGLHGDHVDKNRFESLLECTVLHYVHLANIPFPSFKVKITESDVQSAIFAGVKSGCFVVCWQDKISESVTETTVILWICPTDLHACEKDGVQGR